MQLYVCMCVRDEALACVRRGILVYDMECTRCTACRAEVNALLTLHGAVRFIIRCAGVRVDSTGLECAVTRTHLCDLRPLAFLHSCSARELWVGYSCTIIYVLLLSAFQRGVTCAE